MTFPDVRAALPNLDILSVGADSVELRVDLLKEPLPDGSFAPLPSLAYVGQQLMLLRQRTELPIIFTTRCTNENGRFPMEDPTLFMRYLYRAIQWGCEYIDVELWLPENVRRFLAERKGNSKIISAWHDFSGNFRWTTPQAEELFRKGAECGADVVKMIALVNSVQENYELEYFRMRIRGMLSISLFSCYLMRCCYPCFSFLCYVLSSTEARTHHEASGLGLHRVLDCYLVESRITSS